MRRVAALIVGAAIGVLTTAPALAQGSRRVAFDTVVGVQDLIFETRDWPTAVVFDPFASAQITDHVQASLRPKFWRLNGEWELVLDQASVQYEGRWGSNWRVEAGRFPSPIGLGMTENRSNVNAGVMWWHRPYYMPLPSLGAHAPRVSLVSAIYPDGALISTSGTYWDARVAALDKAPVEFWQGDTGADRGLNLVVGGGVRPAAGLRVGIATASGDLSDRPSTGRYRMVNAEAEYAFGYTRLSGEWTQDRFELMTGTATARGWTAQVQQTLTPRLFAHARGTMISSPEETKTGVVRRAFRSLDVTAGYRVNAEITARVAYSMVRSWAGGATDHHAGVSLMWSRRWW